MVKVTGPDYVKQVSLLSIAGLSVRGVFGNDEFMTTDFNGEDRRNSDNMA